jgi:hypothetical protein
MIFMPHLHLHAHAGVRPIAIQSHLRPELLAGGPDPDGQNPADRRLEMMSTRARAPIIITNSVGPRVFVPYCRCIYLFTCDLASVRVWISATGFAPSSQNSTPFGDKHVLGRSSGLPECASYDMLDLRCGLDMTPRTESGNTCQTT